jgi:hypothetical protein
MRWLERFRMAMLMLFRRQSETARLNDELQFHLDQQVKENIARGLAPDEARYAALRAFGNPTLLRDQARSSWSWNWLENFCATCAMVRAPFTRSPGFALTAILVMALGIGATTSLFTIVRAVLLKPLPFRDPDKLVMVYEHFRDSTAAMTDSTLSRLLISTIGVSRRTASRTWLPGALWLRSHGRACGAAGGCPGCGRLLEPVLRPGHTAGAGTRL